MNFKQSNSDEFISVYENKVLIALTNYLRQTQKAAPTHIWNW